MSDLMDKHTKTGKWYIDGVTTAGTTIAVNGMFLGKVIDKAVAEAIVDAVNGQRERSALLNVEEALRALRQINWRLQKESVGEAECMAVEQQVEAALSQLEDVRSHGK